MTTKCLMSDFLRSRDLRFFTSGRGLLFCFSADLSLRLVAKIVKLGAVDFGLFDYVNFSDGRQVQRKNLLNTVAAAYPPDGYGCPRFIAVFACDDYAFKGLRPGFVALFNLLVNAHSPARPDVGISVYNVALRKCLDFGHDLEVLMAAGGIGLFYTI